MDREPAPDWAYSKLPLLNGFGYELVRGRGLDLDIVAIEPQKCVRDRETCSFISVDERMLFARDSIRAAASCTKSS